MITAPGAFPSHEYAARLGNAQAQMAKRGLAALLLSRPADITYFSGFLTRFWQSPTRPWFLILPAAGKKPVAVIPSIGAALMARTWVEDIRDWAAPDLRDDGVGLLGETLTEIAGEDGRVATPMGAQSHLRMPLSNWDRLRGTTPHLTYVGDGGLVDHLRMIKSKPEISRIRAACEIAGRAFARVPEIAGAGVPLDRVFRRFQMLCLEEGADWVAYLAGGAGPAGYGDVISPADATPLQAGDVLMLDTGVVKQGYFCDFDRNFSIGPPSDAVQSAHARLIEAARAGFDTARPGATAAALFQAMSRVVSTAATWGNRNPGRFGHGLGSELTEGLSLMPGDETVLQPGMVLTLEPLLDLPDGRIMVHEENIVIREHGAEYLSQPASPEMVVLNG